MIDSKKILLNSATTALVAGIATKLIFGNYDTMEIMGTNVNSSIVTGVACGAGSAVSDLSSELVIKKLGVSNQLQNGTTTAVQLGVCGAASSAVLMLAGVPTSSLPATFLLGAGSKAGGGWVYDKVLDPRTGFFPLF